MFRVGDNVTWTSQAGGNTKTKTGKVIAVIPGGPSSAEQAAREIRSRVLAGTHRSAYGGGLARAEDSYVIEVPQGPKAKLILYWPGAKVLKPA